MIVPMESTQKGLSQPVAEKLAAVAKLIRTYVIADALLLSLLWCLVVFFVGGLLDYLPVTAGASETPRGVRTIILIIMAIGVGWIFVTRLLNRLFARLPNRSLAVLIERKYPQLNNELVTIVELNAQNARTSEEISNPAAYQQMLSKVDQSISKDIQQVQPRELLNWQPIWASGVATVFGLVVLALTAVGAPGWLKLWSERLFALSDSPWPRKAVLRADGIQLQMPAFTGQLAAERFTLPFENGIARVPSGAAVALQISADSSAKSVPEVCTLFYRGADGTRGRANLRRVGAPIAGWQNFSLDGPPLDGLNANLDFDIVGLDARLRDLRLEVIEPAAINEMHVVCRYPSYLLDDLSSRPPEEKLEYRSGFKIPEGTDVTLVGKASHALRELQYVVRSSDSSITQSTGEGGLAIQRVAPEVDKFEIPLGPLKSSLVIEVRMIDTFGLTGDSIPRYLIASQEDSVPVVESKLEGIGIAITPNAKLPIRGTVTDDHAIASVNAELTANENKALQLPLKLQAELLESEIDLAELAEQGKLQLTEGMTLGLAVAARDHYNLEQKQHVGLGQPVQLSVLNPSRLLLLLDRQELELRQRLELIISEVEQLRSALQETATALQPLEAALRERAVPNNFVVQREVDNQAGPAKDDEKQQLRRIASLRAQQAVLQGDKSQQELTSIATRVDNIRLQLINNRIDSTADRQVRLQENVHQPLLQLLENDYVKLQKNLKEFQSATTSNAGGANQARSAVASTDQVLIALEAIKSNMLDAESFAEIIDIVQDLLDDQEKILTETEKQQRQRLQDELFK